MNIALEKTVRDLVVEVRLLTARVHILEEKLILAAPRKKITMANIGNMQLQSAKPSPELL